MSYTLTLTQPERAAFDFVGFRYSNGADMRVLIERDRHDWYSPETLTYEISENDAWEIQELAQNDDYLFPLFNDVLKDKMLAFIERIV